MKITPPNNALKNKADVRGNLVEAYIIYPQMDEVNPSITEVKLKACIVAIYVTDLSLVISHWAMINSFSSPASSSPQSLIPNPQR